MTYSIDVLGQQGAAEFGAALADHRGGATEREAEGVGAGVAEGIAWGATDALLREAAGKSVGIGHAEAGISRSRR